MNLNTVNLKFDKISPRLFAYDYKRHKYIIYTYLNPFHIYDKRVNFDCCGKKYSYHFYYEPFYIGKMESPLAYRLNQHLNYFLRDIKDIKSEDKHEIFRWLDKMIKENASKNSPDPLMPKTWSEYKKSWIIPIASFDKKEDLRAFEKAIIKAVGIRKKNTGPLTNQY